MTGTRQILTGRPVPDGLTRSITMVCRAASWMLLLWLCGCATRRDAVNARPFDFQRDTFIYANELVWEYHFDKNGKWVSSQRQPQPAYTHHCFVVARTARQFFLNARFAPDQPVVDEQVYRGLIRQVVSSNPRYALPEKEKIIIPGYPDLRTFSEARESLLKAECGGAWHSYFQRGHWRMIWPLSRHQQEAMAGQILEQLKNSQPVVIHVVRFPQLTINHAMVIFDAKESSDKIEFLTYDPNKPVQPATVTYERASRTFFLPANDYFPGGRVDIYEIYHRWNY